MASIATSVNPDILIIDEALSVGDEYFQKKCVDRMKSFMDRGKTLILALIILGLYPGYAEGPYGLTKAR